MSDTQEVKITQSQKPSEIDSKFAKKLEDG